MGTTAIFRAAEKTPTGTPRERLRKTVHNTGNLFFEEALERQVKHQAVVNDLTKITGIDTLVMCLANFIRPTEDLAWQAELLEASRIENLVMIGAGAQAYEFSEDINIPPGTLRLLEVVAERSKSIGVRGTYTAEILYKYGFKNLQVIGCPSIYSNDWQRERFTRTYERDGVVIHATPNGFYRDKISALLTFGLKQRADYVLQNELELLPLIDKKDHLHPDEQNKLNFFVNYYHEGAVQTSELESWLTQHTRCFFSVDEWVKHLATKQLVVGARFHGNIAALMADTPCLTLVFDTRTKELCEFSSIPYMHLEDFESSFPVEELREMSNTETFFACYPSKHNRYIEFLNDNGLSHNLVHIPSQPDGSSELTLHSRLQDRLISNFRSADQAKIASVKEYFIAVQAAGRQPDLNETMSRLRDLRSLPIRQMAESTPPWQLKLPPKSLCAR